MSPPLDLCADHGLLCVSHPGSKGVFTFSPFHCNRGMFQKIFQQGAAGNPQFCCQRRQLWTFREADWDANLCTCQETVDHAVQFSFLFPWWFMILPLNHSSPAALSRSFTTAEVCSQEKQPVLKHLQIRGLFTIRFHRHPSQRGN